MKVFRAISATTAADVVGRCRSLSFSLFLTHSVSLSPSALFLSFSFSLVKYFEIADASVRCVLAFAGSINSVGTIRSFFAPFRFLYTDEEKHSRRKMRYHNAVSRSTEASLAIQVYLIEVYSRCLIYLRHEPF